MGVGVLMDNFVVYYVTINRELKKRLLSPTDGGGFRDFYHNWTNSILQQLERKF
jgi:hypothetical protein